MIPSEARATMKAYREGRSLEQFLTEMWDRRATEKPLIVQIVAVSVGQWPIGSKAPTDITVTKLKQRGRS